MVVKRLRPRYSISIMERLASSPGGIAWILLCVKSRVFSAVRCETVPGAIEVMLLSPRSSESRLMSPWKASGDTKEIRLELTYRALSHGRLGSGPGIEVIWFTLRSIIISLVTFSMARVGTAEISLLPRTRFMSQGMWGKQPTGSSVSLLPSRYSHSSHSRLSEEKSIGMRAMRLCPRSSVRSLVTDLSATMGTSESSLIAR
mmetsp:Transcript_3626/g.8759  ORF Transcript_3626/g.8759 Transcript_3626/m.8759 type:complete len:202 (+) Transcript_3626:487-1092(+)